MQRYLRVAAVVILITAVVGTLQFGWLGGAAGAGPERPRFDNLTPPPFTTVSPGPVLIGAHAYADTALTEVQLLLDGVQIEQVGSPTDTFLAISEQRVLSAGIYTATVTAVDSEGHQFQAQWDFIVSSNLGDGEWFNAGGQPNASQINATMQSLVEAFRWHLFGLSWDGSSHPDLPSHVGLTGTGDPVGPWVTDATFDIASTEATLRSLVEAFRWHFWGISWDGANHPDVPSHASSVQPPQSIDPWFTASGDPIPANISATLRSLVEAFRWHFWGYSWDGDHHPDIPSHVGMNAPPPTPMPSPTPSPYPAEGMVLAHSTLTDVPSMTGPTGAIGTPTVNGYKLTIPPDDFDGVINTAWVYGDASYSLTMRTVSPTGESAGCLVLRAVSTATTSKVYTYCLVNTGSSLIGSQALYLAASSSSSTPVLDELGQYVFHPSLTSTNWNTIKVIAKQTEFWFFVNGTYLGKATHSGSRVGLVGFIMYNLDVNHSQSIEFTHLTVRALASSATSSSEANSPADSTSPQLEWLSPALRDALHALAP